jgi:Family of unknown function (DUF6011)
MTSHFDHFNDDLGGYDIQGVDKTKTVHLPQADTSQPCRACQSTGKFRSYSGRVIGDCFKCKGTGRVTARQIGAQKAKITRENNVIAGIEAFKQNNPEAWAWILREAPRFEFANAMSEALKQWGRLTDNQLAAVMRCVEKNKARREERAAQAPVADTAGVDRLKAAFDHAIAYSAAKGRTLTRPRITLGDTTISPAKENSANPGALYVKAGQTYLGKIASGRFFASRECTPEAEARVLAFLADPKAAAEAYGIETGVCCVCNATLTNKESIERGIGPICAERFGW